MGARQPPQPPASGICATDPAASTNAECTERCWREDYVEEIDTDSNATYFEKYKKDGTKYDPGDLPKLKFKGKIYAPVRTGDKITVEVRFKAESQDATKVTAADVTTAKTKLENGVNTNFNDKFTLEADDPLCGKKTFKVVYKVTWVDSGEDFTVKVYETYAREGVNANDMAMNVSKTTSDWIYAHEFGHCIGLPDEYSYVNPDTETLKYKKPDGSLDAAVSCPYNGKPSQPDSTIMSTVNSTTVLERHGWNVAIEVQRILTAGHGREIKCTIKR
jgi:type VI secretion system secreted protein VgrG